MKRNYELEREIEKMLYEDKMYCVEGVRVEESPNGTFIAYHITIDGDWKHEHGMFKQYMSSKGFQFVGESTIGESLSDDYMSEHHYIKVS